MITVGAPNAGAKSNIVPDRATLLLNVRNYDKNEVRAAVLAAIERIVWGVCHRRIDAGAGVGLLRSVTAHYAAVTAQVTAALPPTSEPTPSSKPRGIAHPRTSAASRTLSVPCTYWLLGSVGPDTCRAAAMTATVTQGAPGNHSPVLGTHHRPTLSVGVRGT